MNTHFAPMFLGDCAAVFPLGSFKLEANDVQISHKRRTNEPHGSDSWYSWARLMVLMGPAHGTNGPG